MEDDYKGSVGVPLTEHHAIPNNTFSYEPPHERNPKCWCNPSKIIEGFHIFYNHNRLGEAQMPVKNGCNAE